MPFDREGTLRKAEKLVRQGRLDLAIAEYRSVIEDHPSDWNTANTLGDLYNRAGQLEKAVIEYTRTADHLAAEGFQAKAVAVYKKILKIKPDDERAMWQLGCIAARQGLFVDARSAFGTLLQRRKARGDERGTAEVRVQLGDLDGADLDARLAGAQARVDLGEAREAVERLKQAAADLQERGKKEDALLLLIQAAKFDPGDTELKQLLMEIFTAKGDFDSARQYAVSLDEMKTVADELFKQGREDEGLAVLVAQVGADPSDLSSRARIATLLIKRGDVAGARQHLTLDVAGSDPDLLWALAEMELRDGRIQEGTSAVNRVLAENPARRDDLVILGCSVAAVNADAGFECIEVAARAAISADEWGSAAAALNEFVNRVPHHIPALMHLVEICVDGGLEATMHTAQAQLADAYLEVGAGNEARVIAEDLVAREPWERANIERFRRALALLGEKDIDAMIAERLSGQSPFTSTDVRPVKAAAGEGLTASSVPESSAVRGPIDLQSLLEEAGRAEDVPVVRSEPPEVDLSEVLHDLRSVQHNAGSGPDAPDPHIENVLKALRDESRHDTSPESAEQHYTLANTYLQMGMVDDAIKALEAASRSARHGFVAGAMLAKLYSERGEREHAIEWYERAAEAPAPTREAAHELLYDLAAALDAQGESARALAVFLELQTEAGEYRDLSARLERLTKVQMGS